MLIRSIKKNPSNDNRGKSANEIKKFTTQRFTKSTLRSSNCLFLNFCTPFRTKVMPVKNRDIFMEKTGIP